MSAQPPGDDPLAPSEERLLALLLLLRGDDGRGDPAMLPAVMQTVRWQRTFRHAARAVGDLALALADGLALVAGIRRDPRSGAR